MLSRNSTDAWTIVPAQYMQDLRTMNGEGAVPVADLRRKVCCGGPGTQCARRLGKPRESARRIQYS